MAQWRADRTQDSILAKRGVRSFRAFSLALHIGGRAEDDILATKADDFGSTQTGLHTGPGARPSYRGRGAASNAATSTLLRKATGQRT